MKACAMNASRLLLGLVLLQFASAAVASPAGNCLPKVEKAWIRAAPPAATMLAGYAQVRNDCELPLLLVGAKSPDFMMAQVHESRVENGTSRMERARRSVLPAKGMFALAPGGHHLMLMHPRRLLPEGSVVKIDLLLEDGRRVPAEFRVRKEAPEK
jgi:periplasmic copper chaperone A